MDKPKHGLLNRFILSLTNTVPSKTCRSYKEPRLSQATPVVPSPDLALDKHQAISFKAIKACYPFTIKGELFSLLCYQPEAVPTSLKTLTYLLALMCQYLPLI